MPDRRKQEWVKLTTQKGRQGGMAHSIGALVERDGGEGDALLPDSPPRPQLERFEGRDQPRKVLRRYCPGWGPGAASFSKLFPNISKTFFVDFEPFQWVREKKKPFRDSKFFWFYERVGKFPR